MLQKLKSEALNESIEDFLLERGAISIGFATKETLAKSPPSADITYLMKSGQSTITFVLPMKKEYIRPFLAKEDRSAHERDDIESNTRARKLSLELAEMIKGEGYNAIGTATNFKYRTEVENWRYFLPPDTSHRYLAVASGAGSFGWFGNVGVKDYGSALVFGTTITDAHQNYKRNKQPDTCSGSIGETEYAKTYHNETRCCHQSPIGFVPQPAKTKAT